MKYKFLKTLKFITIASAALLLATYLIMTLWNYIIADIFPIKQINLWQAGGLLILSKIFFNPMFGNKCCCRRTGRKGIWKKKFDEKLGKMTPEEKENFKAKFAECCGIVPKLKEDEACC